MYRHAGLRMSPSPARTEADDVESEICAQLLKRREEIDQEIAKFTSRKEKEFREFEKELRSKKKRSKSPTLRSSTSPSRAAKPEPGALGLVADGDKPRANGSATKVPLQERRVKTPPPSKPTLSLDKLTINGTSTPRKEQATPPAALQRLSRSPSNQHLAFTPPRVRSPKPPIPGTNDRNDTSLSGVFTPAFLPLLDSNHDSSSTGTPEPSLKPPVPVETIAALALTAPDPTKPKPRLQRSFTDPTSRNPNTSSGKPSALRTPSGTLRSKRKRVTFQLADSAIVEPSSSYEETATPSPRLTSPNSEQDPLASEGARQKNERRSQSLPETDQFYSRDNDPDRPGGVDLDAEAAQQEEINSPPPLLRQSSHSEGNEDFVGARILDSRRLLRSDSAGSGDLLSSSLPERAADGGSGVGFFELDEELSSPDAKRTSFEAGDAELDDDDERDEQGERGTRGVKDEEEDLFDIDDDNNDDATAEAEHKSQNSSRSRGKRKTKPATSKGKAMMLPDDDDARDQEESIKYGSFTASSLPVDIVSSTGGMAGRFAGSFGR